MSLDIRSCKPDELRTLVSLLDTAFVYGKGRRISLAQRFPTVFCQNNVHNLLLCTEGAEIVSSLAIRPFGWRAGSEHFRAAMIGAVFTQPLYRGRGLASSLLLAAEKQLRESTYDFCVLWTNQPSFYVRLGWDSADCGLIGEMEIDPTPTDATAFAAPLPVAASAQHMESIRWGCLPATTLRQAQDYHQLPLPAESVVKLWLTSRDNSAYALAGNHGELGFLYEMVGDTACFPALWDAVSRDRRRMFVNDRIGSMSERWLADQVGMAWQRKNLAMWLPLSKRAAAFRSMSWYIPYFDRI